MRFRFRSTLLLASVLAGALVASCDGGGGGGGMTEPPVDGNPFDGTGVIGPAGGTIALGDGISIDVPAGALSEDTEITITRVATPADLQQGGAIGQAYRIAPVDLTLSPAARIFIFVSDAVIGGRPLSALTILRSTTTTGGDLVPASEELGNVNVTGGALVSGTTSQFGIFSAAATEPPNQNPSANAGPDQSADTGDAVTVNGSGSDPDGDPLSFAWTFQSRPSGSAASLSNANTASASFTADVAGTYVLLLTVSDGNGGTATDTVTVNVTDPPANQVNANAGPDQTGSVGVTVNLDGRNSTGTGLTFAWRFVSTPAAAPTLNNPTSNRSSFVPNAAGDYLVELTVTDGATADRDTVRISVVQPNRAPTLSLAGPNAVLLGQVATVIATTSDPDGDPVQLNATLQGPAGSSANLQFNGNQMMFTPDVPGQYTVNATANDGQEQVGATANVFGNLSVGGTYNTTFATTAVNGCGDFVQPGSATDTMQVIQDPNDPSRVTLNLTEVAAEIQNNPTLTLRGMQVSGNPQITVGNSTGSVQANGTFNGSFTAGGAMNLTFSFSALTCTVSGTITGQKI